MARILRRTVVEEFEHDDDFDPLGEGCQTGEGGEAAPPEFEVDGPPRRKAKKAGAKRGKQARAIPEEEEEVEFDEDADLDEEEDE